MTNSIEEAIATFRANHEINDASDERATRFTVAGVEEEIRQALEALSERIWEAVPPHDETEEIIGLQPDDEMWHAGFKTCRKQLISNLSKILPARKQ